MKNHRACQKKKWPWNFARQFSVLLRDRLDKMLTADRQPSCLPIKLNESCYRTPMKVQYIQANM